VKGGNPQTGDRVGFTALGLTDSPSRALLCVTERTGGMSGRTYPCACPECFRYCGKPCSRSGSKSGRRCTPCGKGTCEGCQAAAGAYKCACSDCLRFRDQPCMAPVVGLGWRCSICDQRGCEGSIAARVAYKAAQEAADFAPEAEVSLATRPFTAEFTSC
jgi:hypothetical protein